MLNKYCERISGRYFNFKPSSKAQKNKRMRIIKNVDIGSRKYLYIWNLNYWQIKYAK